MSQHNHNYANRTTRTCAPLAIERGEVVCIETVKHYYNANGLALLRQEQNRSLTALDAYDVIAARRNHNDILTEITAVE